MPYASASMLWDPSSNKKKLVRNLLMAAFERSYFRKLSEDYIQKYKMEEEEPDQPVHKASDMEEE